MKPKSEGNWIVWSAKETDVKNSWHSVMGNICQVLAQILLATCIEGAYLLVGM
jgi:hypothetical protein